MRTNEFTIKILRLFILGAWLNDAKVQGHLEI